MIYSDPVAYVNYLVVSDAENQSVNSLFTVDAGT